MNTPKPPRFVIDDDAVLDALRAAGLLDTALAVAIPGQNASLIQPGPTPGTLRAFVWCGGAGDEPAGWLLLESSITEVLTTLATWHVCMRTPLALH